MKLNLLPSHISKAQGSKSAFVLAIIIVALAGGFTFLLIQRGQRALADAKAKAEAERPQVEEVMGIASSADTIIAQVGLIDRNLKLITAMEQHNTVYTNLYRDVLNYVPDFYRITSLSATPAGETTSVAISGVLKTEQQYADLAIAMFRVPGVTSVNRSGFTYERDFIPGLTIDDQEGARIKQGESNLPSDPIDQMNALIQRAGTQPRGFLNQGGFGSGEGQRGAMPKWSTVNLTLVMTRNIQTPNPRATLDQQLAPTTGRQRRGGAVAGFGGGGR